jgi:hypothetical protein
LEEKSGLAPPGSAASFGPAAAQASPVKAATARRLLRELNLSMSCSLWCPRRSRRLYAVTCAAVDKRPMGMDYIADRLIDSLAAAS